jgi:hypothetical protein
MKLRSQVLPPSSENACSTWCEFGVLLAYDQLLAEGFATGRAGSGTYVSEGLDGSAPEREQKLATLRLSRFGSAAVGAAPAVDSPRRKSPQLRYDFGKVQPTPAVQTSTTE